MLNKPPVLRFCHKIDKHTAAVDVITLLPPGEFAFHFHHLNRAISIGQHKIRGIVRRRELHIAVFFSGSIVNLRCSSTFTTSPLWTLGRTVPM